MLFSEIIGHKELKNRLIETVLEGRISHTLLFYGPEGAENLHLSIAYAQFISCTNRQTDTNDPDLIADSCGECPSCKKYQNLAHPDLNFIYPVANTKEFKSKPISSMFINYWREILADNQMYISEREWYEKIGIDNKQGRIGVDDANEINNIASKTPYESPYTVVIIWLAEKLYHAAAPKLLKILEEPPENTLFFLLTHNTDAILKTILSRTQKIKLYRHSDQEIHDYLERYFNIDPAKLDYVVNLAEGNFKNVFPLLNQSSDNDLYFDQFRELMLYAYGNNFQKMKESSTNIANWGREKTKGFLINGLRIVRLCVLFELGNNHLLRATAKEYDFIQKFSKFVNASNAEEISEEITMAIKHIGRNGNAKIIMLDFALKMVVIFSRAKKK